MSHHAACLTLAIAALWLLPGAAAGDSVRAACSSPAPGHAACMALQLVPTASSTAAPHKATGERAAPAGAPAGTPTPGLTGVTPEQLHKAYELPAQAAEPQTIAIVDAYDDPNAEADLAVFDQQYSLPPCTHENGCFSKLNQQGLGAPMPKANGEWSIETSTDIEVAHSLCENCRIVLVESTTDGFGNLERAEDTAAAVVQETSRPGALEGEISNSWGGREPFAEGSAFTHPGIVITASAGDSGYLNWQEISKAGEPESPYFEGPSYPASSPRVVAVGGTSLTIDKTTGEWIGEEVWNNQNGAGGGGCSSLFTAPPWQPLQAGWAAVGCDSERAVADIAADADPKTGVHVYDTVVRGLGTEEEATNHEVPEWIVIGGTSVASPIIASAFALGGGAHGIEYPAATLYAHAGSGAFHDITSGGNGECDDQYTICGGSLGSPLDCGAANTICNAAPGYDGPTGVGTPIGLAAFQPVPGEVGGPGGGFGGGTGGGTSGTANPGTGTAPPPIAPKAPATQLRILRLSLTTAAIVALNRSRPQLAKIAFTFTLSAPAIVHATLARWVRVHGHWRWATLRGSNSFAAHAGVNRAHLQGRGALPAGRYRLTLTPAHGIAGSIVISIG